MAFSGIPLPRTVYDVEKGGPVITGMMGANALTKSNLDNAHQQLINQYYAPNIQSEINKRIAETKGIDITNQYLPEKLRIANSLSNQQLQWNPRIWQSEIGLRGAQGKLAGSEADKINYLLNHPGLMGDETSKQIQSLIDFGLIDKNNLGQALNQGNNNQLNQQPSNITNPAQPSGINQPQNPMSQLPATNQGIFQTASPFNTGNKLLDTILNKPYANAAYQNQMTKAFNWVHLPVETKNQLVAQGYGMGIEPLKMMDYINRGMSLSQIAQEEGLDPENLPPPIYPPTSTTKTRVQQVQQVEHELDYLNSTVTPVIKRYADTFMGVSPERLKDMFSSDPEAQKRFGEYIGALSLQTGISNGRVLQEGGKPGLEVMRMVRDSALKGIDTHSPMKMSKESYQASQDFINQKLSRGAKIRTTTGMNPMSEIGRNKIKTEEGNNKSNLKPPSEMTTEEIKQELSQLRGGK